MVLSAFPGWFAAVITALVGVSPGTSGAASPEPVVVFAAASLKTALDDVAVRWRRQTGQVVRLSYAGTSALARQVEQGAPADLFISADLAWMDYLAGRGLVRNSTVLLGNRLVLIAPMNGRVEISLARGAKLAAALGDGRLAVANVVSVPAGRYAKVALESLGLWDEVAGRLVQTGDVRAALRLVARGEAPLGIVYATDARAEPTVRVVDTFAATTHPPISYAVAPVAGRSNPGTAAFLAFLGTPAAREVFQREGFIVPAAARRD